MYKKLKLSNNKNGDKMIEKMMSKNIVIASTLSTIDDISKAMKEYDIGFMPVIDDTKVVGVITDRDALLNGNSFSSAITSDIMTTGIITIDINSSIEDALKHMKNNKVRRLIVCEDNQMVGILSISDIINNYNNNELIIDTLKSIFEVNKPVQKIDPNVEIYYF